MKMIFTGCPTDMTKGQDGPQCPQLELSALTDASRAPIVITEYSIGSHLQLLPKRSKSCPVWSCIQLFFPDSKCRFR
ncbi:hypothetical protein RB195_009755 [Necator americanus]|uniref:Uncharacterized protein n=1 Tax=Necator americanus TaxID=51031 RepID=A0ABR1CUR8_NECAM